MKHFTKLLFITLLSVLGYNTTRAEIKTLTFVQTSSSAGTLSGDVPSGVTATFSNTYSTKDQLTNGNSMTLTLSGWAETTTIKGVTLEVKNNKSSGNGTATVTIGQTTLGTLSITGLGNTYQEKALTITETQTTSNLVIYIECPSGKSNNSVYCDKFIVSYEEGGSSLTPSDLALTDAPVALSFDLYNNSSDQTVSYTTSSTGAVTVSGGDEYVTTSVSGTTITVTPVAVTPSAQTITVSQAADGTYAAGSATFTVTVTNNSTNLYIKTGNEDWKPYIYTWYGETKFTGNWPGTQTTETETINGINWHKITVPSNNFNLILHNGYEGQQTPTIGPLTEDTYLIYNSPNDGKSSTEYLIVDFAEVTATDISVKEDATGNSTITNPSGVALTYQSSNTSIATVAADGTVTGVAEGTATIIVSWATQVVTGQGYVSGSTTFVVTVTSKNAPLLYEGFSKYTATGDSNTALNTNSNNNGYYKNHLDDEHWTDFSYVYPGGTDNSAEIGGHGKLGSSNNPGSMTASGIALTGNGTLTFKAKQYNATDGGNLVVTITGATVEEQTATNGTTTVTITPQSNWTDYTYYLSEATGDVSITFATSIKRARIDEIKLVPSSASVKIPTFEPNGGDFIDTQSVTLACATEGADIYYSTDGSDPTTSSTQYTTGTPITLSATTTVKAIAVKDGTTSDVASATFTKLENPLAPTFNPATGSTIAVGSKINITPQGNFGSATKTLKYTINSGSEQTRENVNQYTEIIVTEEMVNNGELEIEAYHQLTLNGKTLTGTPATAVYTVVNPVVTFNQPATIFSNTFDVTLTASPAGATLYYTTDGTDPTTASTPYNNSAITLSSTTTVKAIAVVSGVEGNVFSQTYTKNTAATSSTGNDYYLVTDASTLAAGDKIIIASTVDNYTQAMSTTQQTNNRTSVSVERDGDTITSIDNVAIFTLQTGNENRWLLYTESGEENAHGYIYAATSENGSNNHMKTKTESDINCNVSITIDENNNAIIVFDGEHNEHNTLRFNSTNNPQLFSCYTSTNENPVQIYRNAQIAAVNLYENRTGIDSGDMNFDDDAITYNDNQTVTVNLYRSLVAGCWNAICLPFDLDAAGCQKLFGEGYDLQAFTGVTTDSEGTHLNFSKVSGATITAGTPYIVFPTQTVQSGAVVPLSNVTIQDVTPATVTPSTGYSFIGFFEPTALLPSGQDGSYDKSIIYIGTGNKFVYAKGTPKNPTAMLKGYRAYFTLPDGVELAKVNMEVNCDDDNTTGISSVQSSESRVQIYNNGVYDLQGRKVADNSQLSTLNSQLRPGIYIVNGKKIIIK